MTTTTTDLSVGQRVRIARGYNGSEHVGKVGELNQVDNPCCRGAHPYTVMVDGGSVWAVEVEPVEDDSAPRFQIGSRVRLLVRIGGDARVGDLGTVTRLSDDGFPTAVRFDGRSGGAHGYGEHLVTRGQVEPIESEPKVVSPDEPKAEDSALTEAKAEAKRNLERALTAERELDAFRDKVRDAVIREAEDRGWCSEADNWLEELGLEGRSREFTVNGTATVTLSWSYVTTARDGGDARGNIDSYAVADAINSQLGLSLSAGDIDDYDIDEVYQDD